MEGSGSDGSKPKVWHCPAGHSLEPWESTAGSCDGCNRRVAAGEYVMVCRQCNWYLCERCHPQERHKKGWLSTMADKAAQEFTDLKDLADEVETHGPLAACAAVDPKHLRSRNQQHGVRETDEEITVVQKPRVSQKATQEDKEDKEDKENKENEESQGNIKQAEEAKETIEEKPKAPLVDLLDAQSAPIVQKAGPGFDDLFGLGGQQPVAQSAPIVQKAGQGFDDLFGLGGQQPHSTIPGPAPGQGL